MHSVILLLVLWASPGSDAPPDFGPALPKLFELSQDPYMGFVLHEKGKTKYVVMLDIGVEQIESGHVSQFRRQQWYLHCTADSGSSQESTSCELERTVLDQGLPPNRGTTITQRTHSTADGTLTISSADWPNGKLDFDVIYPEGSKATVLIDMYYQRDQIFLRHFTAGIGGRSPLGTAAVLEFRIPEYTTVDQMPIQMNGMKTEARKRWDAFVSTLSSSDQRVAELLVREWQSIFDTVDEAQFNNDPRVKSLQKRVAAASEKDESLERELFTLLGQMFRERMSSWLSSNGMSPNGRQKVLEFLDEDSN